MLDDTSERREIHLLTQIPDSAHEVNRNKEEEKEPN